MYEPTRKLKVAEHDVVILKSAVKEVVARNNTTIQNFADSLYCLKTNDVGAEIKEYWNLPKLNKIFTGEKDLTGEDRMVILDGIRRWNKEEHIWWQTVKDILGITCKVTNQLTLFLIIFIT